jgi:hypothetical protein
VRVPPGACVTTDAHIGAGQADLPDGTGHGGLDVDVSEPARGRAVVHVRADIGVGHLQIDGASVCA